MFEGEGGRIIRENSTRKYNIIYPDTVYKLNGNSTEGSEIFIISRANGIACDPDMAHLRITNIN
jgi:hypothetical protein